MAGDDFSGFYSSSFDRVLRAVWAFCGDEDVAYDSVQEAFARAYGRWARVRGARSPQGWVTRTAMNLTRRHFRRATSPLPPDAGPSAPGPTTERVDVLAALRSLPRRQRQAVVLHYLADCPVATVADLMGLSEGTVKAHLHRARGVLYELLEVRHA
ncbi:MAG TPA: SigE family RNA polymerase sigma factor [Actinomycetota bacterium]|nr:SigE family RNA polymerase sigma factor [Actinomycetota bacterium]